MEPTTKSKLQLIKTIIEGGFEGGTPYKYRITLLDESGEKLDDKEFGGNNAKAKSTWTRTIADQLEKDFNTMVEAYNPDHVKIEIIKGDAVEKEYVFKLKNIAPSADPGLSGNALGMIEMRNQLDLMSVKHDYDRIIDLKDREIENLREENEACEELIKENEVELKNFREKQGLNNVKFGELLAVGAKEFLIKNPKLIEGAGLGRLIPLLTEDEPGKPLPSGGNASGGGVSNADDPLKPFVDEFDRFAHTLSVAEIEKFNKVLVKIAHDKSVMDEWLTEVSEEV